jgi:hypothetical protein
MVDMAQVPTPTQGYPHKWANIITAPLSEGAGMSISTYTTWLRDSIDISRSFKFMYYR